MVSKVTWLVTLAFVWKTFEIKKKIQRTKIFSNLDFVQCFQSGKWWKAKSFKTIKQYKMTLVNQYKYGTKKQTFFRISLIPLEQISNFLQYVES